MPFQRGEAQVVTRQTISPTLNLETDARYNAITAATVVYLRRVIEKAIIAGETFPPAVYSGHLDKGAALPPEIVIGLILVMAGLSHHVVATQARHGNATQFRSGNSPCPPPQNTPSWACNWVLNTLSARALLPTSGVVS